MHLYHILRLTLNALCFTVLTVVSVNAHAQADSLFSKFKYKIVSAQSAENLLRIYDDIDRLSNVLHHSQVENLLIEGFNYSAKKGFEDATLKYAIQIVDNFYAYNRTHEEIDTIKELAKRALAVAEEDGYNSHAAHLANKVGEMYLVKGEMFSAMEYYNIALLNHNKTDQKEKSSDVLSNISYIYSYHGDHQNAIKYSKQGLKIAHKLKPVFRNHNIIYNSSSLVVSFLELGNIDSSEFYFKQGINILDSLTDKSQINNAPEVEFNLLQSGLELYIKTKDFVKAEEIYNRIRENQHFDSPYGQFLQIRYAKANNDLDKLGLLLHNAAQQSRDTNLLNGVRYLRHRSYFNEKLGNYKEAFVDLTKAMELERKSNQDKILNYAEYMQSRVDLEEQKNEINLLTRENDLKSYQIKTILGGLAFLLFASLLYFIQNKKLKEKNNLLYEQSQKINTQAHKIALETASKENLLGNISHELKTPLTLISSSISHLLNRNTDINSREKHLKLISIYSDQLNSMTNQILELAKTRFEPSKVKKEAFRVEDLINHINEIYHQKASAHNLDYVSINHTSINQLYITDVRKLITVIKNLNQNAIKFSKKTGSITSSYLVENNYLIYTVKDEGFGIDEKHIPFLFDRFYQTDDQNKANISGFGLGLAICKENIELLSGEINVESAQGEGSSFTVKIPLEIYTNDCNNISLYSFPITHQFERHALPNIKNKYIEEEYVLIVDDNKDLCFQLHDLLSKEHHLSFAHDGAEALEHINIKNPIVIITDWMMKGMSGDELVKYLKTDSRFLLIPILMLTAKTSKDDKTSLLRIGLDSYISKPFDPENLRSQLNYLIDLKKSKTTQIDCLEHEVFSESDLVFLKKLEKVVQNNISNFNFNLGIASESMNISLRQLNRKVRQLTGLTPMQYINEIRFEEAKKMLEQGDYDTVKAVIYSVGFKAEKNFSRNFKKRFGKYPKEFLNTY